MTALSRRALRTALLVVTALHLAHCPSASWGPDTGCVQTTQNVGRLFPDLVSDAGLVLVRIDATTTDTLPSAQYLAGYTPAPSSALTLLPRLSIDECRCVRSDGQDCEADAGIGAGGGDTFGGTPMECPPIALYGINPHGPIVKPDAGLFSDTCVFSETDCLPGERCVERKCSAPVSLRYDPGQQKYVATPSSLPGGAGLGGTSLTIELGGFIADAGLSASCPASTTTGQLTLIQPTVLVAPAEGESVARTAPLSVRWENTQAGFALAFIRGSYSGLLRTLVCRGLDNNQGVTFTAAVLGTLDPGPVEFELVRMNATSIVPLPIQSGALLSISSQKRTLTLR